MSMYYLSQNIIYNIYVYILSLKRESALQYSKYTDTGGPEKSYFLNEIILLT